MEKLLMLLMIDCNKSAQYCDKAQYNEASTKERFRLNIHLIICKLCKGKSVENTKLTRAINEAKLTTMSKADKEILKTKLQKEISNH
jgi:cytochrome c-type biogenesis protein CcmH/NrfF